MATEDILSKQTGLEVGEKLAASMMPSPIPANTKPVASLKDEPLVSWIKSELVRHEPKVKEWREESRQAYNFMAGEQLDEETRRILRLSLRPDNAFNTTQKFIRFVSGLERRAPQALLFHPLVMNDELRQFTAELLTEAFQWALSQCEGDYERSRAFEDMLICGLGWTDIYLDRLRDPRGLVQLVRKSPFEMLWPDCGDEQLRTTRWRACESWVDREDAIRRWPERELLLKAAADQGEATSFPSTPLSTYTVPYIETTGIAKERTDPSHKGKVKILEWQWVDDLEGVEVPDPTGGEPQWMTIPDFMRYRRYVEVTLGFRTPLPPKQIRRVTRVVNLLNRHHLLDEPRRLPGDRFTFNVITGHFDEMRRLWYGFLRVLIDPQRYANKFFNQMIEIVATTAKSGIIAEQDAFNPGQYENMKENYSKPGSIDLVAPEAISKNKIMPKQAPQMPPSVLNLLEWCVKSQESVTGIGAESLGLTTANAATPALTMRQRQHAGLVLLAPEFDSLSRYRREEARAVVSALALIADNRMIRIGGPEAQGALPLLKAPFLMEYDVELDDTEHDPNLRQMYTNFIMQMGPTLMRTGMWVPDMIDYLPFPTRIKQQLKKSMMQQAQERQRMAAMGIPQGGRGAAKPPQETAAKVEKLKSDALLHQARAAHLLKSSRREDVKMILDAWAQKHQQQNDQAGLQHQVLSTVLGVLKPQGGGG